MFKKVKKKGYLTRVKQRLVREREENSNLVILKFENYIQSTNI